RSSYEQPGERLVWTAIGHVHFGVRAVGGPNTSITHVEPDAVYGCPSDCRRWHDDRERRVHRQGQPHCASRQGRRGASDGGRGGGEPHGTNGDACARERPFAPWLGGLNQLGE